LDLKHKYDSKTGLLCEFTMPNIDRLKVSLKWHAKAYLNTQHLNANCQNTATK